MVKKKSRRSTSGEEMATALDCWDEEEGGAQNVAWPLPCETSDLRDVERGAWNASVPPLSANGMICLLTSSAGSSEHAASGKSHDAAVLKTQIARFLHDHKGASGGR
jgi:hypothetical protein